MMIFCVGYNNELKWNVALVLTYRINFLDHFDCSFTALITVWDINS